MSDDMILTRADYDLFLGSKELLPCPFCGCRYAISSGAKTPNGRAVHWTIRCDNKVGLFPSCTASVWDTDTDQSVARANAVAKWNRRDEEVKP